VEEVFKSTLMPDGISIRDGDHRQRVHPTAKALISIFDTVTAWMERNRQRRTLANLPDYMLKDIGISRVDAWREAGKPFWRA
jgi:uncharacterized protein YjiS (DUF1127 family)